MLRLSRHQWAVLLEAVIGLLWARWQLTRLPFRQLASQLGTLGTASPQEGEAWQAPLRREVRWAVQGVARYLPGRWTCLVVAMAARHMLARRGLSCTLYLGVSHAEGGLRAHAWLRCGSLYVTGGRRAGPLHGPRLLRPYAVREHDAPGGSRCPRHHAYMMAVAGAATRRCSGRGRSPRRLRLPVKGQSTMSRIHRSSTIARSQSQISTHLAGEVIILGLTSQEFYSLDGVGARIWELLQEPRTVQALVEMLLQEYDVERQRCAGDLLALVQELAEVGCIEVDNDTTRL